MNATALRAPRKAASAPNVVPLRLASDNTFKRKEALVNHLMGLVAKVVAGEVTGFTYAAVQPDGEFFLNVCGDPRKNPSMATAMASAIWFQQMRHIFGEDD